MSYSDVFSMLWSVDEDYSNWRYKRRGTVLGKWHQIKKEWWKYHVEQGCLEMGLPPEEWRDPPAFDLGEIPEIPNTDLDLSDVPF